MDSALGEKASTTNGAAIHANRTAAETSTPTNDSARGGSSQNKRARLQRHPNGNAISGSAQMTRRACTLFSSASVSNVDAAPRSNGRARMRGLSAAINTIRIAVVVNAPARSSVRTIRACMASPPEKANAKVPIIATRQSRTRRRRRK